MLTVVQRFEAAARYKAGEPKAILAKEFGCAEGSLAQYGFKFFPDVRRPHDEYQLVKSKISKPETRTDDIVTAFRSGLTLHQVGEQHNITRERVRQILKKLGVPTTEGGARLRGQRREEKRASDVNARCYEKYGLTRAEWEMVGEPGRRAYREQRRTSFYRGIKFTLTLAEWWAVWQQSGKWEQRGRGGKNYCMSRIKDEGGYVPYNVYITTGANNGREYRSNCKVKCGDRQGVYLMYPGYSKPWMAKYGKISLGLYATEAEARTVRNRYIKDNRILERGRGKGYHWRAKANRYIVNLYGRYRGSFKTLREAEAAVERIRAAHAASQSVAA